MREYKVTKSGKSYYTIGNIIYPYFRFVGDE